MSAEVVFNELSLQPQAADEAAARRWMSGLVQVLRRAREVGGSRGFRTKPEFFVAPIAEAYSVVGWCNDRGVDEVERRLFRSFATKSPMLDGDAERGMVEELLGREFRCGDAVAEGLGVAYCLDGLGISFASSDRWAGRFISLEETRVNELGELGRIEVQVGHASCVGDVDAHAAWLRPGAVTIGSEADRLRGAIEGKMALYVAQGLCAEGDGVGYSFGGRFIPTARGYGLFGLDGPSNLLAEACARLVVGKPKTEVKPYRTKVIRDGWRSRRVHLTEGGEALRLMLWVKPDGDVVFANVGPKAELWICEECEGA
jgi:hypothetical protein